MSSSNNNTDEETPLPSASPALTPAPTITHSAPPRHRPTVSFSETRVELVYPRVYGTNSAPSSPGSGVHSHGAAEGEEQRAPRRATTVVESPSLPLGLHTFSSGLSRVSSLIRKRGTTMASGSSTPVPTSPRQPSSPQRVSTPSSWKGEVINSPFGHKRTLSKTSPYHAASLSMPPPMTIQPLVPSMILSGSMPLSQDQQPGGVATPEDSVGYAGKSVKKEPDAHQLGSSPVSEPSQPQPPFTLTRIPTGPGGRSLEVDTSPPTRMRKLTNLLTRLYDKYSPSLTLENKGSVARDHLANERTFLAWLRTSLSLITVGVAITQLFRLQAGQLPSPGAPPSNSLQIAHLGRPLGGAFLCLGILFLWLGTSRYFHGQTVMSYGKFPASRGSVILATLTVLSVLLACFIIVIVDRKR